MDNINKSIQIVNELEQIYNKLNIKKYDNNIKILNNKLYKLYLIFYEKYNLSSYQLDYLKKKKNIYSKKNSFN
jgi:hypothetical protein